MHLACYFSTSISCPPYDFVINFPLFFSVFPIWMQFLCFEQQYFLCNSFLCFVDFFFFCLPIPIRMFYSWTLVTLKPSLFKSNILILVPCAGHDCDVWLPKKQPFMLFKNVAWLRAQYDASPPKISMTSALSALQPCRSPLACHVLVESTGLIALFLFRLEMSD